MSNNELLKYGFKKIYQIRQAYGNVIVYFRLISQKRRRFMSFLESLGLPDMNHDGEVDFIDEMIVNDLIFDDEEDCDCDEDEE